MCICAVPTYRHKCLVETWKITTADHIYNDILKYKCIANICLMGDFNCRTGNLHEYTQDENDGILDISNINYFHQTIEDIIDNNQNVQKARVTVDTNVNEYGKELINICRINYLYILNGIIRTYSQCVFTGHTAVGQSAVDDIIMDSLLLCHVHKFHIEEPTPLSDHCGITAHIQYNKPTDTQTG